MAMLKCQPAIAAILAVMTFSLSSCSERHSDTVRVSSSDGRTECVIGWNGTLSFELFSRGEKVGSVNGIRMTTTRGVFPDPRSEMVRGSVGNRVHQMALCTVLESPLMVMADSLSRYDGEAACAEFITPVPVTWDDSVVRSASIGRYLCVARRKGDEWHIGAITNRDPADMPVDFSLLKREGRIASIYSRTESTRKTTRS